MSEATEQATGFDVGARVWRGTDGRRGVIVGQPASRVRVVWAGCTHDDIVEVADLHPANPKPRDTVSQSIDTPADLEQVATTGVIVEDWVGDVARLAEDGSWHVTGLSGMNGPYGLERLAFPVFLRWRP